MWKSLSGSFNVATHTHVNTVIGTRSHLPHFAALIQQPLDNPSQARDKRCRYPPAAPLSPTLTVNLHVHCTFRSSFHYVSLCFVSFRFGFKYWIGYWVSVSVSHSVPHTPVDSSANRFASYLENLCGAKARCLSDKLAAAWKRETVRPLSTHRQTDTRPDTHPDTHPGTHIHIHRHPHTYYGQQLILSACLASAL